MLDVSETVRGNGHRDLPGALITAPGAPSNNMRVLLPSIIITAVTGWS